MTKWTKASIQEDALEKNVKFIHLMFTDIRGTVKNVEIPVSQLEKALNNNMTFDGSSIEGFVRIEESDMYLLPDYNTWLVYNWQENTDESRVASLVCDVESSKRQPFSGDPRGNLRRILKKMEDMGFSSFQLGAEPEFFLFQLDGQGKPILNNTDKGGYFDMTPTDLGESCRRDIVLELERLGFSIESSHHEVAPGQHEIDWSHTEAIQACDNLQIFKLVVKTIARKHNLYATFMPKPLYGVNGSGMHFHMSLFDKDGKNAFYNPKTKDQLSQTALYFIGGLLKYAPAFTAICNPLVNSYKRLVDGYYAPVYVAWSEKSRSPLVRIPASRGDSTRVELRSVDPSANPYLALAVILQAGLDGIENKITPPRPIDRNVYAMSAEERIREGIVDLPSSLREAVQLFEEEPLMTSALGQHITENFVIEKRLEYESYRKQVTQWEIDKYLMLY